MLDLKFKVTKIDAATASIYGRIEIFAEIVEEEAPEGTAVNPEEEKLKNNIVTSSVFRDDKQIENDFKNRMEKMGSIVVEQIQLLPGSMRPRRKEPVAAVFLIVTDEQFNRLGRPTVGDYLPMKVFTEKFSEIDSPP